MAPALLFSLFVSCSSGCTVFLVVASSTTRGEADRGARLRAEIEDRRGMMARMLRMFAVL